MTHMVMQRGVVCGIFPILSAVRSATANLARLGGDEFGVLLTHVTLDQAKKKGLAVAESLRTSTLLNGLPVSLSFLVRRA